MEDLDITDIPLPPSLKDLPSFAFLSLPMQHQAAGGAAAAPGSPMKGAGTHK